MKDPVIVILSLIALGCIVLSFLIDWLFLIPAVLIFLYNQKRLMKNNQKKNEKDI